MIQKLLLSIQMIWITFIKILKNTIQIKKRKIWIVFYDMIAYMPSNKKINSIVTDSFIRGRKLNTYLAFEQSKKQIKTLEEHAKQLVESNELIKKDFNIDRDSIPFNE